METASWRDVVRRDLFGSAPDPRDRPYRFVIRLALIVFRLFGFRFDVRGAEHVPATGGAIICSNHVSYLDFTFLGLGALPARRLVRFMAKASVFGHWFAGPFMRAMGHIPVDRRAGAAAFQAAVRALQDAAQRDYPRQPAGPDDLWWQPAHLGGTAPTPDQAKELDAADYSGARARLKRPHPLRRLMRRS